MRGFFSPSVGRYMKCSSKNGIKREWPTSPYEPHSQFGLLANLKWNKKQKGQCQIGVNTPNETVCPDSCY